MAPSIQSGLRSEALNDVESFTVNPRRDNSRGQVAGRSGAISKHAPDNVLVLTLLARIGTAMNDACDLRDWITCLCMKERRITWMTGCGSVFHRKWERFLQDFSAPYPSACIETMIRWIYFEMPTSGVK